jgi:hypothetical protein
MWNSERMPTSRQVSQVPWRYKLALLKAQYNFRRSPMRELTFLIGLIALTLAAACSDAPYECEDLEPIRVGTGTYVEAYGSVQTADGEVVENFLVEIDRDAERVTVSYRLDDQEVVETYRITGSNLEP